MNNTNVEELKTELDKLISVEDFAVMIPEVAPNFTSDAVDDKYEKIKQARERSLPTYRSEYRVIKTLIRQRNLLIAHIKRYSKDTLLRNLVSVSELLSAALKTISDTFEYEKDIASAVEDFEKLYVKNSSNFHKQQEDISEEVTVKVTVEGF